MTEEPRGGWSGGFMYMVAEEDRGDPKTLYSLFASPPDRGKYHTALRDVRRPGDAIVAKPFGDHGVAVAFLPDGGGQTTEAVCEDGLVVCYEQEADGAPLLVWGLVADHVRRVEVVAPDGTLRARLADNAFAAFVQADQEDAVSVVIHRADGTKGRV